MPKGDSFDQLFEAHVTAMKQRVELSHPTKAGKAAAKAALFGEMTQGSAAKIATRGEEASTKASATGPGKSFAALSNGSANIVARLMLFAGGEFEPSNDQVEKMYELPTAPPAGP